MSEDRVRNVALAERVALRPAEAARAVGLSERMLRKLMKQREIPFFHIGGAVLFRVEALRAWAEQRERLECGGEVAPLAADSVTPDGVPAIADERRAKVQEHARALVARMRSRLGPV